jgi:cobalt-zinc-cadmium efflux system membrane fusion protein
MTASSRPCGPLTIIVSASLAIGCGTSKDTESVEAAERARATPTEVADAKERAQGSGQQTDRGAENGPARVELKSAEVAEIAGLEIVKAIDRPEGAGIVVTASIAFDATKRAVINARVPGIVRAIKRDVGAKVSPGGALAVIESAQVGADRSRISGARTRLQVAEASYKREADLQAKGISAMKDLLAAQQELEAAKSELASLTSSLEAVGHTARGGGYTLTTPIAGVVVSRAANIGKLVGVEETLFEVVDTSTMWAEIDVPEDQLTSVTVEQPVVVTVDGLGARQFRGVISYLAPQIDPKTRTARARAALSNPDGALRANMFARARIVTAGGKPTVTVPDSAVQRIGDDAVVFVRISKRLFEARQVELGADDGATVEVIKGVRGGDEIVAQGAFLLKSEMLKSSIQADED